MNDKQQTLTALREEFNHWEALLASLSETQIAAPSSPTNWSVKDVVAHLRAWQQRSIARMEAALHNREPEFPKWPETLNADSEEDTDQINAWIYETSREKPWPSVYRDWREGFLRFMELGQAIPEKDLLDAGRYPWLAGRPLSFILVASCEHHEEHLEPLLALYRPGGSMKTAK